MRLSPEKAVLVGISLPGSKIPLSESLEELGRLADTAGAEVAASISQKIKSPDRAFFIGSGKVDEVKQLAAEKNADLVIFGAALSSSQERNLESALGIKVIDRTELIIDIFAQHARSREGKLQVELAQSSFLLTRLTGHGASMSRLGGGIGTRGPGETRLEYDRRKIREKISLLKKELEKIREERALRREKRKKNKIPLIALVGYTNSGKSTLLNALTRSDVYADDRLFATLDPTTRRFFLPEIGNVLITDTVGFITSLPHPLVAAFSATLEEVSQADLLVHVVDAASKNYEDQISAVYTVLEELQSAAKPMITVFNKRDLLKISLPRKIQKKYFPSISLSALLDHDFSGLKELIKTFCPRLPPPA